MKKLVSMLISCCVVLSLVKGQYDEEEEEGGGSVGIHYERRRPLITAHRGSVWYFPEHTIAAYYYAFFEGAHFIDVDLHPTKDGSFVAYHDFAITPADTPSVLEHPDVFTKDNMNQYFQNKQNRRIFKEGEGWAIKDFTVEQLTQLTHKMRYGVHDLD